LLFAFFNFVRNETLTALTRAVGASARPARRLHESPLFNVVEVTQSLVESAAKLATAEDLRSLAFLHLAAALVVPARDRAIATWDRRLWRAANRRRLRALPADLA
jgi:predicted nucleic acid-binding protein